MVGVRNNRPAPLPAGTGRGEIDGEDEESGGDGKKGWWRHGPTDPGRRGESGRGCPGEISILVIAWLSGRPREADG